MESRKKSSFLVARPLRRGEGGLVAGPLKQNCFAASLWHANGPFYILCAFKRLREIKIIAFGFKVYKAQVKTVQKERKRESRWKDSEKEQV